MGIKNNSNRSQKAKKQQKATGLWHRHKRLWRWLIGVVATIVILIGAIYVAFQVSPWPNSMLIRYEFHKNSAKVAEALEKHIPAGVASVENQQYRLNDKDAYLDVFYPEKTASPRGTVVWVHGGAWVSGNKDDTDNYLKVLASHGYTTVSINYSIAPEHQYPLPIQQLNDALGYLQNNADRLYVDPDKIVLAGDSAGSQIVAQMATVITSQAYASEMNISSKLSAGQLKGMLLNCGAYDLSLPDYNGPFGGLLHTVLWAYSGKKDFLSDPSLKPASVVNYVTKDFPPTFITAGNIDPLEEQSTEFEKKLSSLGVTTSPLFYPKNHQPELSHEYQFDLDNADGKRALAQMVKFLDRHIK